MAMQEENNKIELVFPESNLEEDSKFVRKGAGGKVLEQFSASIDNITSWFKQYQVETIELWISGGIQTEGIIKLAVSAKGEEGFKLRLKPKNQTYFSKVKESVFWLLV
jgi:hypothetical protein